MRTFINKRNVNIHDFHSHSAVDAPLGTQGSCQPENGLHSEQSHRGASTDGCDLMFGQGSKMASITTSSIRVREFLAKAALTPPVGLWTDRRGMISIEYALLLSVVITSIFMGGLTVHKTVQSSFSTALQTLSAL